MPPPSIRRRLGESHISRSRAADTRPSKNPKRQAKEDPASRSSSLARAKDSTASERKDSAVSLSHSMSSFRILCEQLATRATRSSASPLPARSSHSPASSRPRARRTAQSNLPPLSFSSSSSRSSSTPTPRPPSPRPPRSALPPRVHSTHQPFHARSRRNERPKQKERPRKRRHSTRRPKQRRGQTVGWVHRCGGIPLRLRAK
ncbi:hypothetical protein R3P38DRAFT_3101604, partial [Favolaschia claudopus]